MIFSMGYGNRVVQIAFVGAAGLLMFVAFGAGQAIAGASDWAESDGGRLRIVSAAPDEDGTIRAMLEIDLLPGWKTYWRDPGESGIPPTIDIAGSENIESVEILFPPPERIDDGYSVWAGYTRSVRLPLMLAASDPDERSVLQAHVFLGVCDKVCIPVQADLAVTIDDPANPLHEAMIEQAFANLPEEPGENFGIVGASSSRDELEIEVRVPNAATAARTELFLAAPEGWFFGVPRIAAHSGDLVTFAAPVKRRPDIGHDDHVAVSAVVTTLSRSVEDIVRIRPDDR
jgi:DsbC/DsbD-like thiol-disulfide interchange protein